MLCYCCGTAGVLHGYCAGAALILHWCCIRAAVVLHLYCACDCTVVVLHGHHAGTALAMHWSRIGAELTPCRCCPGAALVPYWSRIGAALLLHCCCAGSTPTDPTTERPTAAAKPKVSQYSCSIGFCSTIWAPLDAARVLCGGRSVAACAPLKRHSGAPRAFFGRHSGAHSTELGRLGPESAKRRIRPNPSKFSQIWPGIMSDSRRICAVFGRIGFEFDHALAEFKRSSPQLRRMCLGVGQVGSSSGRCDPSSAESVANSSHAACYYWPDFAAQRDLRRNADRPTSPCRAARDSPPELASPRPCVIWDQARLVEDKATKCPRPCAPKVWSSPSLFCFSVFRSHRRAGATSRGGARYGKRAGV